MSGLSVREVTIPSRIAVLALIVLFLSPRPASAQDSLQIHHIDVDQGDATLVVAPYGRRLLIDSGLSSRGDTVARFLQQRDIDTLDVFLATHYDRDHYGGIPDVVESGITVEAWYDRGGKDFVSEDKTDDDGDEYDQYIDVAAYLLWERAERRKTLVTFAWHMGVSLRKDTAEKMVEAVRSRGEPL